MQPPKTPVEQYSSQFSQGRLATELSVVGEMMRLKPIIADG